MSQLQFAQISDIHISEVGDHHDMLSGRSATMLADIIVRLNQMEMLDFVLITGDLLDKASQVEFDQFQQIIRTLNKPYYVIPGNHDRRNADRSHGLTRRQFAEHFNPQIEARPAAPEAQVGYWSLAITPEVQLIGLDSVQDDDWGGVIDDWQVAWLMGELSRHADKLVMVAVHHPLHRLAPIDDAPYWGRFVCSNGPEILALLDDHPQVKMVLTGHHHLTKVDRLNDRLHLACPSIAIFPCAYRLLRLSQQPGGAWQLAWQTESAADAATITEAKTRMRRAWREVGFEAPFVEAHVALALGGAYDQNGVAIL